MNISYETAGVSVERGDTFVDLIGGLCKSTIKKQHQVMAGVGGFAALSKMPKVKNPVLVTSTDGVGTKVLIASDLNIWNTVGIDLVAMSVNDVLTTGAKPWLFLDYYAVGKLDPSRGKQVVNGIVEGCKQAGCALVGGETAEMPGVYASNHFDLAGFCVAIADEKKLITGKKIKPGNLILALPSSGVHSNGFSLVRKVIEVGKLDIRKKYPDLSATKTLGEMVLEPTRIYVNQVLRALTKPGILGMAHITGGGIEGNLERILPKNVKAMINTTLWDIPPLFSFFQHQGSLSQHTMFETFNMGIGYMLVIEAKMQKTLQKLLPGSFIVGEIAATKGAAKVELT